MPNEATLIVLRTGAFFRGSYCNLALFQAEEGTHSPRLLNMEMSDEGSLFICVLN
jgi:hypothetical protein